MRIPLTSSSSKCRTKELWGGVSFRCSPQHNSVTILLFSFLIPRPLSLQGAEPRAFQQRWFWTLNTSDQSVHVSARGFRPKGNGMESSLFFFAIRFPLKQTTVPWFTCTFSQSQLHKVFVQETPLFKWHHHLLSDFTVRLLELIDARLKCFR